MTPLYFACKPVPACPSSVTRGRARDIYATDNSGETKASRDCPSSLLCQPVWLAHPYRTLEGHRHELPPLPPPPATAVAPVFLALVTAFDATA
jgi:hypothetical protein